MTFEALYEESLKKMTLEKEILDQKMAFMENQVTSLRGERMINTNMKEELSRQKAKNPNYHHCLKENEDLLISVCESLKVPHMTRSLKGDSSIKKKPSYNHLPQHLYLTIIVKK